LAAHQMRTRLPKQLSPAGVTRNPGGLFLRWT